MPCPHNEISIVQRMQKKEQLEHQMSRLLNRDKQAERKARTRRLIERGAILESVFPETADLSGEEVKAFLFEKKRAARQP